MKRDFRFRVCDQALRHCLETPRPSLLARLRGLIAVGKALPPARTPGSDPR